MSAHVCFRLLLSLSSTALAGAVLLSGLTSVSGTARLGDTTATAATAAGSVVAPDSAAAAPAPVPVPAAVTAPEVAPVAAATSAASVASILRQQRAAGLECDATPGGVPLCAHGNDSRPPSHVDGAHGTAGTTATSGQIGCYGDGTSGPRVRAVYARPQTAPDRYSASLGAIRSWAAGVSGTFDASAKRTGGRRHVRFATTPGGSCSLVVLNVVLPDSAFASFRGTIDALEARGFDAPASKYLVWADAAGYCGIATTYADDRAGLDNLNNSSLPAYARIDRACWGKVETHEVVHMLGGVQRSARNATAGFHCSDGFEVMCYDDRTTGSKQRVVCAKSSAHLLDCRNDDYFSTAAAKGSYLQTHWNTARSSFLSALLTDPAPAAAPKPTTASPSPSPSASASPSPSKPPSMGLPLPSALPSLPPIPPVLGS